MQQSHAQQADVTTLSAAAMELTEQEVSYDGRYFSIPYPNGDVPGDIVAWDLEHGLTHIGIVVNGKSQDGKRLLILHNIGARQVVADCLFDFKIIGHYSFMPN